MRRGCPVRARGNGDRSDLPFEELSVSDRVAANDEGQHSTWPDLQGRPADADPGTTIIATDRLVLRELTAAQVAGLLQLLKDGGTSARCVPGYPMAGSGFAAQHFTERTPDELRPGFGMYILVRRSDGLAIGDMGFHRPPKDGVTEIGFGLAESARGQGYATEAATALSRWALTQDGVSRVVARTDPDNVGSQNVLTRSGFRHDRTQDDVLHYVLLPDGHPRAAYQAG
jgi:RimJ/RimL family protein N-acetyltransferase